MKREHLRLENVTISPPDSDGDFQFDLLYTSCTVYISTEEAKILIEHLINQIDLNK